MTQDEAFLQAILENPDDDAPRLVYADWLEEQGKSERAECIRIECQLEQLLARSESRYALEDRARQVLCVSDGVFRYEGNLSPELEERDRQLVSGYGARWAGPIAPLVGYWGFRRGLVEEVGMGGRQFLASAEPLFRLAPVRHVSFAKVPPVLVPMLMESPFLARLRSLSLAHNRIWARGACCLRDCPHLTGLTTLDLTHCRIGDAGLHALLSSPYLRGLTTLDLWNNDLSESNAHLLATSPVLHQLGYLSIGCNPLGEVGKQVLRKRFGDKVTFGLYGEGKER